MSFDNSGDASIGGFFGDRKGRITRAVKASKVALPISIRPLDALLRVRSGRRATAPSAAGHAPAIRLMKLDAQGFECRALIGTDRATAHTVHTLSTAVVPSPH